MSGTKNIVKSSEPAIGTSSKLTMEDLTRMFAGRDVMTIRGQGVVEAQKWLDSGDGSMKAYACTVFYEKPLRYVVQGRKNKDDKTSVMLDERISEFLPMLGEDFKVEGKRTGYGAFSNVNMSRVRNVALLNAEYGQYDEKCALNWCARYGGDPTKLTFDTQVWNDMSEESRRIKREGILKFSEELTNMMDKGLLMIG